MGADRRTAGHAGRRFAAAAARGRAQRSLAASGVHAGAFPRRVRGLLPEPRLSTPVRVRELARRIRRGRPQGRHRELQRGRAHDGRRRARGRRAHAHRVDSLAGGIREEALPPRAEEKAHPPPFVQGRAPGRVMAVEDKEGFLSRWSRRKLDAATEAAAPKPAPAAVPAAAPAAAKAELPPVDTLKGLLSEYKEFLRPGVDETLRRAALKKLFSDPHFNVMDGLDVYIDDYSKPDPIPESMLRKLAHAKGLLFDEKAEEQESGGKPDATPSAETPLLSEEAPDVAPAAPSEKKDKV